MLKDKLRVFDLGAHNYWVQNRDAAKRAGCEEADRCAHCSKAMSPDTGWVVAVDARSEYFLAWDMPLPPRAELRRLGNECARYFSAHLSSKEKQRYFRRPSDVTNDR